MVLVFEMVCIEVICFLVMVGVLVFSSSLVVLLVSDVRLVMGRYLWFVLGLLCKILLVWLFWLVSDWLFVV